MVAGPELDIDVHWAPYMAVFDFFQIVNSTASRFERHHEIAIAVKGLVEVLLGLDDLLALVEGQVARHLSRGRDL